MLEQTSGRKNDGGMTEANSSIIVMEKNREYDGESTRSKTD